MQHSDLGTKTRSMRDRQLPLILVAGLGASIVLHVGAIVGISQWWQSPPPQTDEPIEVTLVDPDPITPTPTKSVPPTRPQKQNLVKPSLDRPTQIPIKLPATAISTPVAAKPFLTRTQSPTKPPIRAKISKSPTPKPVIVKKPKPAKPAIIPKSSDRSQPLISPKIAATPPPFDLPVPTEPTSPPVTPQPILSPQPSQTRREKPIASPLPQTSPPNPLPADKVIKTPQTAKPATPRVVRVSPSAVPTATSAPTAGGTSSSSSAENYRSPGTSQNPGSSGGILTNSNRSSGNETSGSGSGIGNSSGKGGSNGNGSGNFAPDPPTGNTSTASAGAGKLECIRNCEVPKLKDLLDTDGGKDRLRIRIAIDANGIVTDAQIAKSSGNPQIDTAALEGIKQMQFVPSGKQISGIIRANILIRSARPLVVPAIAHTHSNQIVVSH
jgi:TonB family protein